MPLPAALFSLARGAISSGLVSRAVRKVGRTVSTGAPSGFFAPRRRRRSSLSATEMGKITFMSSVLGKRNPAVTLLVMKALGGKL